ncbi:MAG: cupin domain-containing protein [Alphaproteobacteria bacterium]|nr:cupin domain-containing protein [Alphaproteobacteria bacterium]
MTEIRRNMFFGQIDRENGFEERGDGNLGISVKILSNDLDTVAKRGRRTRLLRMAPGSETPEAHAHDYWEEIYILEGEMTVLDGTDGEKQVATGAYAAREPDVMHGPVRSETGCLMIDFCWYPDKELD